MTDIAIVPKSGQLAMTEEQSKLKEHISGIVAKIPEIGATIKTIWDDSFTYTDKNEMIGMMVNAAWTAYWKAFKEMMEIDELHRTRCKAHEKKVDELLASVDDTSPEKQIKTMDVWSRAVKDYERDKGRMQREKESIFQTWEKSGAVAMKLANEYRQSRTSSGYYTKTSELAKFMELLQVTLQSRLSGKMDLLREIQKELYEQQKKMFPITITQEEG